MNENLRQQCESTILHDYREIIPNAAEDSPIDLDTIKIQTNRFLGYEQQLPVSVSEHTGA